MRRDVFQAIADPTRRSILGLLARETMNLNAVAAHYDMSRPAISKHIKILSECGLVVIRPRGRERYCSVKMTPLHEVSDWVEQYREHWNTRLDNLDAYLEKIQSKKHKSTAHVKRKKTTS